MQLSKNLYINHDSIKTTNLQPQGFLRNIIKIIPHYSTQLIQRH